MEANLHTIQPFHALVPARERREREPKKKRFELGEPTDDQAIEAEPTITKTEPIRADPVDGAVGTRVDVVA